MDLPVFMADDMMADVLFRDQRTIQTIDRDECVKCLKFPPKYNDRRRECEFSGVKCSEIHIDTEKYPHKTKHCRNVLTSDSVRYRWCTTSSRPRHRIYLRRVLNRLGEVLILGVFLFILVRAPSTAMSAPTSHKSQDKKKAVEKPKWIDPCGVGVAFGPYDAIDLVQRLTDYEIIDVITTASKTALDQAQQFREEYVRKTFNLDFKHHHETWKGNRYDWLPGMSEIPKNLGESTSDDILKRMDVDNAMRDTFQYMQKYAVGLEQIVWDQKEQNSEFAKKFEDAEYKLKSLLCELQTGMYERTVSPKENVDRDVMSTKFRQMANGSYRNIRDWLIFRDYMNALEYVSQVFENFKKNLES